MRSLATPTAPAATAFPPGEGHSIWFMDNRMTIKATGESTGGAYSLLEAWAPAGSGPPLHVHHREAETFWVLEGRLRVHCGDSSYIAEPGAWVSLPAGVPHTFIVEGQGPARVLTTMVPGGGEQFFVEAGRTADDDGMPPAQPPDLERLSRVAERFGIELLVPPLAA